MFNMLSHGNQWWPLKGLGLQRLLSAYLFLGWSFLLTQCPNVAPFACFIKTTLLLLLPYPQGDDLNSKKTNDAGHEAHVGASGKYYCKQRLDPESDSITKNCGPNVGDNCKSCMKVDIAVRNLPAHWYKYTYCLVNFLVNLLFISFFFKSWVYPLSAYPNTKSSDWRPISLI